MVTEALTPGANVQTEAWVEAISALFTRPIARLQTRVNALMSASSDAHERAYEERSTWAKSWSALRLFAPFA